MCFFRRKSKRVAAAKAAAASAASATVSDPSASEPARAPGDSATETASTAIQESTTAVAVLTDRSAPQATTVPEESTTDGPAPGARDAPVTGTGPSDAPEPRDDAELTDQPLDEPVAEPETDHMAAGSSGAGAAPGGAGPGEAPDSGDGNVAVGQDDTGDPEETASAGVSIGVAESAVPSSVDMAPPQPEIVEHGPRDEVWGQDRPGHEGKSVAALNQLIEAVTMSAAGDGEPGSSTTEAVPGMETSGEPEPPVDTAASAVDPTSEDENPDQMEELPSDRPVPADAIRRASEALDAAVNAAPAVLGPASNADDDEAVALVDAELTQFDGESTSESEPEGVASDYSVRVTDPIPVQSLSAPGVSRETSGPEQMPSGTQQPTVGPHGGDDERRSALIATVPAVDDTTPVAAELAMDARRRIELHGRRFPRPSKTRIITVANQKGGVGKTTTTVNVAAGLAQSGLNVLVIDNDPQGNASTALGIEHRAGTPSVYEILVEGESLASTVQQCPDVPNLWGVPATIDLSGSEIELVSLVSRETRLRKAIDKYLTDRAAAGEDRIDYVLIDCPPSLGLLTVNAFVAGREVFIPIQCEYYALEGLSQLLKTIDLIRSHLNPELRVSSILLTMYDGRTNLAQQVAGEVRSHFPAETFKTTIPRSVRISEAPSYGQTVMTYDATSTGALAYLQASRELAERGQGGSSPRRAVQAEPVGAQD